MKKFLILLMVTPLLAGAAAGQTPAAAAPTEPHGVSVVQARWHKYFYHPALHEDPMDISTDAARLQMERREVARVNSIRSERTGRTPLPPLTEPTIKKAKAPQMPASTFYIYEVKVSNRGAKKIRSIVWDYVLFDPATRREVGNHTFETKVGLGPGKSKELVGSSTLPPASTVDVSKSDKEVRGQYSERVDIQRVEYEDGTVWKREPEK